MNTTNLYNFVIKMKVFENYGKNKQKPKFLFHYFLLQKVFQILFFINEEILKK